MLNAQLHANTLATNSIHAGSYPIKLTSGSDDNYSFTLV
ncbi:MBG domain-containing protein [Chryseotalea sanaruensis]